MVYLRSIAPVRNPLPPTRVNFPVNYLIRNAPQPLTRPGQRSRSASQSGRAWKIYGRYWLRMPYCRLIRKGPIRGMEDGGGEFLNGPWGEVTSANITPDASGIGYFDEALFLQAMRTGYREGTKAEFHHALRGIRQPYR